MLQRAEIIKYEYQQLDLLNKRIIVDLVSEYGPRRITGLEELVADLKQITRKFNCTKVIVKGIPAQAVQFMEQGFNLEGKIPGYYQEEASWWVTFYLDPSREIRSREEEETAILETVFARCFIPWAVKPLVRSRCLRRAQPKDAVRLSKFYSRIFTTYPSQITDPDYLAKNITGGIPYLYIEVDGQIISAIGAELDKFNLSAELSDCATDPAVAGEGLMYILYRDMEILLGEMGYKTLFTLARALSNGMNLVAACSGYQFSGQLINNCNICGDYGTMNLWVKPKS
jgi:putative beta-lysine N-acetyltransferase